MKQGDFLIREACREDVEGLLELYEILNDTVTAPSEETAAAQETFEKMHSSDGLHLLVAICDGVQAGTMTVTVIPSLTHGCRPYALIEHVVTHPDFRRRGIASALLERAAELARETNCYKLMLITGRKEQGVHKLYRSVGFSSEGKTAYARNI